MADDEHELTEELRKLGRIQAGAASSSPPASVDAAILARSRDAVRASPRGRRWWIPASVAATALIAVSLVTRIQHESTTGLPENSVPATEWPSPEAARAAPVPTLTQESPSPTAPDLAAAPAEAVRAPPASPEAQKQGMPPRQAMPRMKPGEEDSSAGAQLHGDAASRGMAALEESGPDQAAPSPSVATPAAVAVSSAGETVTPLTPEAWLERIEALEAAGKLAEAAGERALLEEAYPGWLAARPGPH